jgi:lactate permease
MWQQVYDPFNNSVLSTIAAAVPVVTLLVLIATGAVKTHLAALIALVVAIVIAIFLFTMPAGLAIRASILGTVIGFFRSAGSSSTSSSCTGLPWRLAPFRSCSRRSAA